jgi:rod shape-determining protein MreD
MLQANNGVIILLTLVLALISTIMPMPLSVDNFRPDWVMIVLIYWSIALPQHVNVLTAWFMGLIIDVLLGSYLGVHAAALAITIFITAANYQKIRNFSVWQQALIVGLCSALYHLLVFWTQRVLLDIVFIPDYLFPVITSMIVWPWAFLLLRKIRRHFAIK